MHSAVYGEVNKSSKASQQEIEELKNAVTAEALLEQVGHNAGDDSDKMNKTEEKRKSDERLNSV